MSFPAGMRSAGITSIIHAADRPLENTDLMLWHTFTAHHVVRPEDWPVMPVTRVGFQLRADGFLDGNPALDVPPEDHCHSG